MEVGRIEMVGRVDGVEFVEVPVWVSERRFKNKQMKEKNGI